MYEWITAFNGYGGHTLGEQSVLSLRIAAQVLVKRLRIQQDGKRTHTTTLQVMERWRPIEIGRSGNDDEHRIAGQFRFFYRQHLPKWCRPLGMHNREHLENSVELPLAAIQWQGRLGDTAYHQSH